MYNNPKENYEDTFGLNLSEPTIKVRVSKTGGNNWQNLGEVLKQELNGNKHSIENYLGTPFITSMRMNLTSEDTSELIMQLDLTTESALDMYKLFLPKVKDTYRYIQVLFGYRKPGNFSDVYEFKIINDPKLNLGSQSSMEIKALAAVFDGKVGTAALEKDPVELTPPKGQEKMTVRDLILSIYGANTKIEDTGAEDNKFLNSEISRKDSLTVALNGLYEYLKKELTNKNRALYVINENGVTTCRVMNPNQQTPTDTKKKVIFITGENLWKDHLNRDDKICLPVYNFRYENHNSKNDVLESFDSVYDPETFITRYKLKKEVVDKENKKGTAEPGDTTVTTEQTKKEKEVIVKDIKITAPYWPVLRPLEYSCMLKTSLSQLKNKLFPVVSVEYNLIPDFTMDVTLAVPGKINEENT